MESKQDVAPAPTPNRVAPLKPPVQNPVTPKPAPVPTPTPEPVATPELEPKPKEEQNMMAAGTPKKNNKGMILGMVFLAILAIAGIGFGVWTMLDSNTQKDQLNSQITALKAQNSELLDKLADSEAEIEAETEIEDTEEQKTISLWPATMGEIGYKFYVINDLGEVITSDSSMEIKDVVSCDIPVGPQTIKEIQCGVVTREDKEGVYFYNGETGILKFYTADEWKTYLDSQK